MVPKEWPTQRIRLDKVDPNPWNPNRMSDDAMAKLRRAVEDEGLGILGHIVVRPRKKGRYELVDGEHRLAVYRDLGMEEAEAIVAVLDDDQAKVAGLVLNELRGQPQLPALSALVKDLATRRELPDLATVLPWRENVLQRLAESYGGTAQDSEILHGPQALRLAIVLEEDVYAALMAWAEAKGIHAAEEAVVAAIREVLP